MPRLSDTAELPPLDHVRHGLTPSFAPRKLPSRN
jgi:hypothetical protein